LLAGGSFLALGDFYATGRNLGPPASSSTIENLSIFVYALINIACISIVPSALRTGLLSTSADLKTS
jgi:hypothetical protein